MDNKFKQDLTHLLSTINQMVDNWRIAKKAQYYRVHNRAYNFFTFYNASISLDFFNGETALWLEVTFGSREYLDYVMSDITELETKLGKIFPDLVIRVGSYN